MERSSNNPESECVQTYSLLQRFGAFCIQSLVRLLSFTFLPVNHFYGSCVGYVLWAFDNESKRVSATNLAIAFPELDDQQRDELLKESLVELGKTITELGPLWSWSEARLNRKIKEVRGIDVIEDARRAGRGVIMLAPHFGAWEMSGLYLSMHHEIVSLYRPPRFGAIDGFIRNARQRFGAELVPTNISGVRSLCRSLKQNNLIGILPDQDPGPSGGIQAPFFGYSARTMVLVSRLARKTKSSVVFCITERLPRGQGYRLHYIAGDSRVASADDYTAASALNEDIESIVRMNPSQYQWSYKRFKGGSKANPYRQPQRRAA